MAGFNADKAVQRLDYTFGANVLYEGRKIEGITPEPDDEQLAEFHRALAEIAHDSRAEQDGVDINDRMAVAEWMATRPTSASVEMEKRTARVYAAVCSHKPSFEEIMAVPPRVRSAWYMWLAGELHPEGSRPATTP